MIASLRCFWFGHKWPRVGWDTHKVGDTVSCQRRGCRGKTAVRCEDCGGPVTLPAYRTSYIASRGGMPLGILLTTPCSPSRRIMFDPRSQAAAAARYIQERYSGEGWRRYIEEDRDA